VDNQHKLIKGYRDLSKDEIDLMNEIKNTVGSQLEELVDKLFAMENTDKRWVAIGKTDLQTGLMALVRSIATPSSF
jgi:hypothetical protein